MTFTDLDTSRSALGDGVGHGGTRGVDHTHEADEAEVLLGEVGVVRVELVADGVLVRGQLEVAEAEHTLAETTEFEVRVVECFFHFLV